MSKMTVMAAGAALLLTSATAVAFAETYRWVDPEGNIHYGDRPVQGSEQVDVRVPGKAPEPGYAPLPVAENGEGEAEGDAPEGDEAEQVRSDLCKQAQERLARYEKADGIYEEGPEGERRELTLEERVNTILEARKSAEALCAEPSEQDETAL